MEDGQRGNNCLFEDDVSQIKKKKEEKNICLKVICFLFGGTTMVLQQRCFSFFHEMQGPSIISKIYFLPLIDLH